MTLDRVFTHTIKGHFCSLLVSNILCYPHFLISILAASHRLHHTILRFLLSEICFRFDALSYCKGCVFDKKGLLFSSFLLLLPLSER